MKTKFIFVLLVISALFLSGCSIDYSKIISKMSKEDVGKLSKAFVQCDPPYIRHGGECCLDKNDNNICDADESKAGEGEAEAESEAEAEAEAEPEPEPEPAPSDCAIHFTKINADEMAMCGGGSMGGDPIVDAYGCRGNEDYPPEAEACAEGTNLNNVYAYGSGTYRCYVSQEIGVSSAPAGCPIAEEDVVCYEGFVYDAESSNLAWGGGGSSWGCSYKCKSSPNPPEDWPCTKEGYKPIGGGGGDTCCAKW